MNRLVGPDRQGTFFFGPDCDLDLHTQNIPSLAALFLIGLAQSVFLAALLLRKPQRGYSDVLLGSWMLVVAVHFLLTYFRFTGVDMRFPHLLGMVAPLQQVRSVACPSP